MKQALLAGLVCVLLMGCSKQGASTSAEGTSAKADLNVSTKDQKKEIDAAAKDAQRQVSDAAKAQKELIKTEAKAAKAEIDATKAEGQALVKEQQKNLDAESQRIQNAVGSAAQSISGSVPSVEEVRTASKRDDEMLLQKMHDLTAQSKGLDVSVENGTVTLRGTVNSQKEKDELENRVKQAPGVQNVKNEITVNDNAQSQSSTEQQQNSQSQQQSNQQSQDQSQPQPK